MEYKTELHCHVLEASSCAEENCRDTTEKYIKYGYSTLVLTNHFSTGEMREFHVDYEGMIDLAYNCMRIANETSNGRINILVGFELRLDENDNDYLVYGATKEQLLKIDNLFSKSLPEVHEIFKKEGIIIVHAHPMRNGTTIQRPRDIDGYEVFNGHMDQISRNEMTKAWAERLESLGGKIIKTSGSDHHDPDHLPSGGIITDFEIKDLDTLVRTLKSGNYSLIETDLAGSMRSEKDYL